MKAKFNELYDLEKLDALFEESHNKPIVFFKHSIACPISRSVFQDVSNADAEIWLMVVQDARKVSNAIAEKTGIKHESPQTIIIRDGKAIYHSSHYDSTAASIENALEAEKAAI